MRDAWVCEKWWERSCAAGMDERSAFTRALCRRWVITGRRRATRSLMWLLWRADVLTALNDITIAELEQFVASAAAADPLLRAMVDAGSLKCLPSGQASTLLDLSTTGAELNTWVTDELQRVGDGGDWLLVLDGMGRSLESNWCVRE